MIQNKKVLILGMARSGIAIAKLLANYQNEIIITDLKKQEEEVIQELESLNIKIVITEKQEELINSLLTSIMSLNERIQRLEKLNNQNNNIMEDMEDVYHKSR